MLDPNFQAVIHEASFLGKVFEHFSLFGIFFISFLVSYIVPLPEAVFLVFVGFLVKTAGANFFLIFFVSILGTITGDNFLYRLSLFGNSFVQRLIKKVKENKLNKYQHLVVDNVGKATYFLRFVVGVRFFGPITMGILGIKWKNFFIHNAISTAINSLIFMGLGYFTKNIILLSIEVEIVRNALFFSSAIIVAFLLAAFAKKSGKK